jgi:hypothetical protein
MSRTQESGAYLGGIGAMLEVPNVCLSCGEVHTERQFGFRHGPARECPKVILGRFPVVSEPAPADFTEVPIRISASQQIRGYETPRSPPPVSMGSLPSPRRGVPDSRFRGTGVPWLPPPDLGEVI